jgi:hypothetical protein
VPNISVNARQERGAGWASPTCTGATGRPVPARLRPRQQRRRAGTAPPVPIRLHLTVLRSA